MGESILESEEHLLMMLPFPEPTELIAGIKIKHPQLKITYHRVSYGVVPWVAERGVPDETYATVTVLFTLSALPPDPTLTPHLELIQFISAGTDHTSTSPFYTSTQVPLCTSSGVPAPQIAEWVMMTALAFSHDMKTLVKWQEDRTWGGGGDAISVKRKKGVRGMVGQRMGILGIYIDFVIQVARLAQALGMSVIVHTANPRPTPDSKRDTGYIVPHTGDADGSIPLEWHSGTSKPSLHKFLSRDIDFLLISVPLTQATEHLLSSEEFAILGRRRNAFVSNISRGKIVDQKALIEALKMGMGKGKDKEEEEEEGGLRGAALDVTDPEPLDEGSELWELENVMLTPHVAWEDDRYLERAFEVLEGNLRMLEMGVEEGAAAGEVGGEGFLNEVRRERGY
ncbi:MAG: hypothetical protein M1836_001520 [Candelina mexicana]|nr:MAG: hypothetical protein M1836_001520 [Candelina mexicana]